MRNKNNLGSFIAGAAAAAAGMYYLYGPQGKERREKIKAWTERTKSQISTGINDLKESAKDKFEQAKLEAESEVKRRRAK